MPTKPDEARTAQEALELVRRLEAQHRALAQVTMHMLATLGATAPSAEVEELIAQLERIRDRTGPTGVIAAEVIATALTTLERAAKR